MKPLKIHPQAPIVKKIFFIPVIAIFIGIAGIAYISSVTVKEGLLNEMRSNGIQMASHLIGRIEDNQEALNIINTMLEKEIQVAGNMVVARNADLNNDKLKQMARELGVTELYWYNNSGKIIYSNIDRYIGWQAPKDHPVDKFFKSGKQFFIEKDIRKDSDSDNYGKNGYFRADNGDFVQVVIDSQDIEQLTQRFSYQVLVEKLTINDNVIYALYMDENLKIVSHSRKEYLGTDLSNDPEARSAVITGEYYSSEYVYKPKNLKIYDVIVPVMVDGKPVGALNLGYSMDNVQKAVKKSNGRIYALGTLLLGVIILIFKRVQKKQIIDPIIELDRDIKIVSPENHIEYRLPIKEDDPFIQLRQTANTVLDKTQMYFQNMIENQNDLLTINEELEATLAQLSANEQQLMAQYDKIKVQKDYIQFLADHDSLTGLQNRRKFTQTLEAVLKKGFTGAILLLDIDNFKNINDTLGHIYGDKVLKYVANLLKDAIYKNATAYRFGGDEFLINIQDRGEFCESSPCIKAVLDCFKQNHTIEGIKNHISVSTGIVRYPLDGDNVEDLLMNVDIAMYSAKMSGKNQSVFFGEHMTSFFLDKIKIENILRNTLATDDFVLLYQPIIEIHTGEVAYFEALIRIRDSNIYPGKFIPIAEETRLILPIGRWVITEALSQLRKWIDQGHMPKPIAINLSPKQMQDATLVDFLTNQLEENGIDSSLIEIEITENLLIENREHNIATLKKIQALGISISLDDFGTGYSSLNYLTYIPVNKVKLDKSLKDKFIYHESSQVMSSLISLIHALQLQVVIEGVEETHEFIALKDSGGDYLQGYLFSRPVPASEAETIFKKSYLELLDS